MPTADRCTTVRLDLRDLPRAVEDPKLASLLADGWRPIGHIALSEDDGVPGLVLLLAPPMSDGVRESMIRAFAAGACTAALIIAAVSAVSWWLA